MALCECGCGTPIQDGYTRSGPRRFVSGHNLVGLPRTKQHKANIAEAQRLVWQSKRQRLPVGSTNKDSRGYVRVKVTPGKGPWRKEHQVVMETLIGRRLRRGETVHHINGVRDDNRLENLHLFTTQREHNQAEASLVAVFRELMDAGLARFNKESGRYEGVLQR